jgi:hypothetical protein
VSGFGPFGDGPNARTHRRILAALLLGLFAFVGFNAVRRATAGKSSRYDENVTFSRALVYDEVNVYEVFPAQATHTKYPPFYFVYVAPFVPLPTALGATLWFVLNLTLAIATLVLAVRLAWPDAAARAPPLVVYALLAGVMGWIAVTNLSTSQVNIQIGFFVVLGLYLIHRGLEGRGGFALMVATMLKLTPALLIVWLAVRGRWRAVRGAAVGFALLWGIVAAVLGPRFALEATRSWIDVLIPFARDGVLGEGIGGVRGTNQSLAAALFRFFADVPAATRIEHFQVNVLALSFDTLNTVIRSLNVLLLLVAAWILGRGPVAVRSPRFVREAALLMVLTLVISPITWSNHHIALILPYALCLQAWRDAAPEQRRTLQWVLGLSIALFLLGSPCPWLQGFSLPLVGVVLVGVLLGGLLRGERRGAEPVSAG